MPSVSKHHLITSGSVHEIGALLGTWPAGSGIYAIRNNVTHTSYVGSAKSIKERWRTHRTQLRTNKHGNRKLQNAWNKYGEVSFVFVAICAVEMEDLIATEQMFLDAAQAVKIGYNLAPTAGSNWGIRASDETKAKMSTTRKGRPAPWRLNNGHPHTEETKAKMSQSKLGKKMSLETKKKMSVIASARVRSPETRAKQAASLKAAHARRISNERSI